MDKEKLIELAKERLQTLNKIHNLLAIGTLVLCGLPVIATVIIIWISDSKTLLYPCSVFVVIGLLIYFFIERAKRKALTGAAKFRYELDLFMKGGRGYEGGDSIKKFQDFLTNER
ncbi:MAG TPA: hypothetical protein VFU15_13790 [Bacteroidia bacterium]|nr:hypothetical protein [Bacteroidia bacterium]